jgi:hypothetical protein
VDARDGAAGGEEGSAEPKLVQGRVGRRGAEEGHGSDAASHRVGEPFPDVGEPDHHEDAAAIRLNARPIAGLDRDDCSASDNDMVSHSYLTADLVGRREAGDLATLSDPIERTTRSMLWVDPVPQEVDLAA